MPLIRIIDPDPSGAGYKFDMMESTSQEVVKVFATRDAVVKAVGIASSDDAFDKALVDVANEKFDRGEREEDGTILIKADDFLA